ncbi:MFS transporter [Streptomyces sp. NPDC047072]|uniref:MFS transporter n=1 Tax=Streptomyces sp. NPDC047072 TaxID=3154809 RepID=UPI0033DC4B8B
MHETGRQKWWALGAVSLSILAVSLDGTVLSVALPTLARSLDASQASLEWFSSGYLLMLAAAVLPAGLIGDRYGRKKLLLFSLALFGVGSVLCAYAPDATVFLIARLIMGVAGAGVTVMALSALTVLFTDEERPRAVGIYEAANFLALPLGPVLGGWMLSHFWWGWVFLLNVPVVVVGLVVGMVLVPESRASDRPHLDPTGIALSTTGLVLLTYGLVDAGEHGWTHPVSTVTIVAGLALLGGFFLWEKRVTARGGQPLIDPALFRSKLFTWGALLSGVSGLSMVGLLFVMPQYFQAVRGVDALGSGLRLLPLVGGLILGAAPASRLARVVGAKLTVSLGFALIVVGSLLGTATSTGSSTLFVAVWMTVLCAGTGLTLTAATAVALSQLSADRSGIGSAVVQAFQKTSAPLGTAVMGSVVAAAYQGHLALPALSSDDAASARHSVYEGMALAERLRSAALTGQVQDAFTYGIKTAMLVSAGIALAGIVLALVFLPHRAERGTRQDPAPVRDAVK